MSSPPAGRIVAIAGRGIPVRGDDIDTDRITPGRRPASLQRPALPGSRDSRGQRKFRLWVIP